MTESKTFDVFLSYNRDDGAAVEVLARRLKDEARLKPWLDEWQLVGGDLWQEKLEQALDESRACAVFIGPSGLSPWQKEELRGALDACVAYPEFRVIPVLLPGVTKPEREILPLFLSQRTWVDFRGPEGLHDVDAFDRLVAGLRGEAPAPDGGSENYLVEPQGRKTYQPHPDLPQPSISTDELRNRSDLLAEVKREVTDRLRQSLHCAVLGKETKPQEVRRPWDIEVKVTMQQSVLLAPDTEIIQVFDEEAIAGKLLILGAPGAGKTTTLLQLAEELVKRAETDTREPMPVLMNLTSWKDDSQTIASSLVAEMHVKYGIRKDISQHWLDERSLLPLFDGLDEMEAARQEKCVQAINEFQQAFRPEHLVVCCRLAEYQNCQTKLQLNGAVHLQPLTEEQIHHYLTSGQHPELWNDIQAIPELLELARSPLLLSMMALVSEEEPLKSKHGFGPTHEGRRYLFNKYIELMLARVSKDQQYARDRTLYWLGWLARGLRSHAQTEFLLETLQPSWLESPAQKLAYRTCVSLIVVAIFLVSVSLKDWMMDFLPKGQLEIMSMESIDNQLQEIIGTRSGGTALKWMTIILALFAGLFIALQVKIKPIETLRWSGAKARTGIALWLRRSSIGGLKYGAYTGQIVGLVVSVILAQSLSLGAWGVDPAWGRSGQIVGIVFGLMAGVATLLIARSSLWSVEQLWDWQMIRSAQVLISGFIFGLAVGLWFGMDHGAIFGLLCGGFSGLGMGLMAGLGSGQRNHLNFRVADGVVVGLVGWLISGVLTWSIGRQLLKGFKIELSSWMGLWLLSWLGIGGIFGLAAGLIAKLSPTAESVETRQGTDIESWGSFALKWRRLLIIGVVGALVASLVLGLVIGLGERPTVVAIAFFCFHLGMSLTTMLGVPIFCALMGAGLGINFVAVPGALIGSLAGLTGPDIEQRTMPNQGIRHAAVNAGRFALIGGLVLGSISGLSNLVFPVLWIGLAPNTWDWFSSWLSGVLLWGLIAAFVPGAACIQHFTLRFILWCRGVIPWHYARFLDYATERMFLQRVGGRYRFIHDLLRDHFAATQPKQSKRCEMDGGNRGENMFSPFWL